MDAQTSLLSITKTPEQILICGGGTGDLLVSLLARYPLAQVTYLELSARMIEISISKLSKTEMDLSRITFIKGDVRSFENSFKFDQIHLPFILDVLTSSEIRAVLINLKKLANQDGELIVTDFCDTNWKQGLLIKSMYLFFRVTAALSTSNLPNINDLLAESGWKTTEFQSFKNGLIFSSTSRMRNQ